MSPVIKIYSAGRNDCKINPHGKKALIDMLLTFIAYFAYSNTLSKINRLHQGAKGFCMYHIKFNPL